MECNSLVSVVAKTKLETTTSSTAAGSENCIFMFAAPFFGVCWFCGTVESLRKSCGE